MRIQAGDNVYRENNGRTVCYVVTSVFDGIATCRLKGTAGNFATLRFDVRRMKPEGGEGCWTVNR